MLGLPIYSSLFAFTALSEFDASTAGYRDFDLSDSLSNITLPESIDLEEPDNWLAYAKLGQHLYQAWEQKTGNDQPFDWSVPDECRVLVDQVSSNRDIGIFAFDIIKQHIDRLIIADSRSFLKFKVYWPKDVEPDEASAKTVGDISPRDGIFIAESAGRGEEMPKEWHASHIAWWMWEATVDNFLSENCDSPNVVEYSTLNYVLADAILTGGTLAVLDHVLSGIPSGVATSFFPDNKDLEKNPFWTLLGSKSGGWVIHMLTERKQAMKNKGIISLSVVKQELCGVVEDRTSFYSIWATLG